MRTIKENIIEYGIKTTMGIVFLGAYCAATFAIADIAGAVAGRGFYNRESDGAETRAYRHWVEQKRIKQKQARIAEEQLARNAKGKYIICRDCEKTNYLDKIMINENFVAE